MADSARDRIAANVRAELARAGKTQRDLADILGIPQSSVWHRLHEDQSRDFKAEEVAAIAAWLKIPVDVLLVGAVPERAA